MKEDLEKKQLADECVEESLQRFREGRLKDAIDLSIRARDIYHELDTPHEEAKTLNLLAIFYDEIGNWSLDLHCLLDGIDLSIDNSMYDMAAKLYNNLGSKYIYSKAYEKAEEYFTKALEMFNLALKNNLASKFDSHTFVIILNMNLATIYCYTGDFERARDHYNKAKKETESIDDREILFTFATFESLILWKIGEREHIDEMVDSILNNEQTNDYATDFMELMSNLLELLTEKNDFGRRARVLHLMNLHISKDAGLYARMEMVKRWIDYYKDLGDEESYIRYCVEYYKLTKEKEKLDYEQRVEAIDLNIEMRRAIRQKRKSDSIVYVDSLTGIGNRNRMLEDSVSYINKSVANHTTITIGLIDIDFFKECNDTYGHVEGDSCLKRVAHVIENAVGDRGNVYRYGGDEFLLLLPEMKQEVILSIGKAIKEGIETEKIPNRKSPISEYVTVSQGYTMAIAEAGDTIDVLVDLADRVLYRVKRYGRNDYRYIHFNEVIAMND